MTLTKKTNSKFAMYLGYLKLAIVAERQEIRAKHGDESFLVEAAIKLAKDNQQDFVNNDKEMLNTEDLTNYFKNGYHLNV